MNSEQKERIHTMPSMDERLTYRDESGKAFAKLDLHADTEECMDFGRLSLEKLCRYEESEEQGLLVTLPCKVGSIVELRIGEITQRYRFMGIIQQKGYLPTLMGRQQFGYFNNVPIALVSQFGKTVFLVEEKECSHD